MEKWSPEKIYHTPMNLDIQVQTEDFPSPDTFYLSESLNLTE